jgi:hypothetical protein
MMKTRKNIEGLREGRGFIERNQPMSIGRPSQHSTLPRYSL